MPVFGPAISTDSAVPTGRACQQPRHRRGRHAPLAVGTHSPFGGRAPSDEVLAIEGQGLWSGIVVGWRTQLDQKASREERVGQRPAADLNPNGTQSRRNGPALLGQRHLNVLDLGLYIQDHRTSEPPISNCLGSVLHFSSLGAGSPMSFMVLTSIW